MSKRTKKGAKLSSDINADRALKILKMLAAGSAAGMNYKQISRALGVSDKDERESVRQILFRLVSDRFLKESTRGKYILAPEHLESFAPPPESVSGKIEIKRGGSAYVIPDEGEGDIYVAPYNTGGALNGDKVRVRLLTAKRVRRKEGVVTEIIQRAREEFAGIIKTGRVYSRFIPDSNFFQGEIFVPNSRLNKAVNGSKVLVKITGMHDDGKGMTGEVSRVLGMSGENEAEMHAILSEFGFPSEFPAEVEKEARKAPKTISEAEIKSRRDFRSTLTFTIDPEDAKDFDDALSLRILEDERYEVGVHIADVSHYVPEGSAVDKEAFSRGTSVYLADRVVPMLPESLSNELCSLKENEDRLCFSAVFIIGKKGDVQDQWFGKTVIRSQKRFHYEEAQQIIEGLESPYSGALLTLQNLAVILREERFRQGSIAFETEEVRFSLDAEGKPLGIYIRQQKDSNRLIEEFMLLANRSVAEWVSRQSSGKMPKSYVYRVHDEPNPEKLQIFSDFAGRLGYKISAEPGRRLIFALNKLFASLKGKKEENLLNMLAVRTMARAEYSTVNIGHYGLGFAHYSHFTSPIRRYPDLIAHRLLLRYLNGGQSVNKAALEDMCKHASEMERRAVEAERASVKLKQAEYLLDKVGGIFPGTISGISKWGVYVELSESKCEGMVQLRDMGDDIYYTDEDNMTLSARYSGKKYRLGDAVRVKIKSVNLQKKQIDYLLVGPVK